MEYARIMYFIAVGTCFGFITLTIIVGTYIINQGKWFRRKFKKWLEEYPIEPDEKKQKKKVSISLASLRAYSNALKIVKEIKKAI